MPTDGWLRECRDGYIVLDDHGRTLLGPNEDLGQIVQWAGENGILIRAEDLGGHS